MTGVSDNSEQLSARLTTEEHELGMNRDITRRDFLNTAALGTGAALLGAAAPGLIRAADREAAKSRSAADPWHPWTGYAGVGDYSASNGNTWEVVSAGHGIRDRQYEKAIANATATGETQDLVIIGGGYSGVVAAYTFLKETKRQRSCLILENHPIMGGEAKRNEFIVRGQRLMGPQGSNATGVPSHGVERDIWHDVGLPTEFEFGELAANRRRMEFPSENYMYLLWADIFESNGFHFDSPRPHWVTNPWGHDLKGTPWAEDVRRDLLRWRNEPMEPFRGDEIGLERWLDTMTYDDYLTKVRKFHPEVARYVDPMLASGLGLGSDVLSANAAYFFSYPGFQGLSKKPAEIQFEGRKLANSRGGFCFPGGNDGQMRYLLKWLNPEMIEGSASFPDVYSGRIRFDAMDRPNTPCRMRTGATVVRVLHDPDTRKNPNPATVIYAKDGKLYSVNAKTVIWAGASFTAKHAVEHLPDDYRLAMESFTRAPMLVVNVALNNWRFLYNLGYTACSWRGGFGYTCNMVAPMYVGDYRPRLDPDSPVLLTFYVPFNERGPSLADQGRIARGRMFATSFRDYETQIRQQMVKLFGAAGFDPGRDIAGIVLNRWGHAYVTAGPGFFYGVNGQPSPSDVLRRPLGSLAFAHSELSGHQYWGAAAVEGKRAAEQMLAML